MNIKELAKICGVSTSTVSKAFHNDSNISDATKSRILETAKQYHYIPYSDVLKTAVPNLNLIAVAYDEKSAFERSVVFSLEKKLFQHGYNTVLFNLSENEDEARRYFRNFESKGISGFVFLHKYLEEYPDSPAVLITQDSFTQSSSNLAVVHVNVKAGDFIAIDYLIKKGHKKIAFYSETGENERFAEFENAFKKSNGYLPKKDLEFAFNVDNLYETVLRCISERVTAVICDNEYIAHQLYIRFLKMGISIPDQISIVCLRDPQKSDLLPFSLSSVSVSIDSIAETAVEALLNLAESDCKGYEMTAFLQPEIFDKGSIAEIDPNHKEDRILVIGSINMDYNLLVKRIPSTGETVRIKSCLTLPGGKGGNQAVGIGKVGGHVNLIGCLGDDQDGHAIYELLQNSGVSLDGVSFCNSISTGKAYITVEENGESTITILSGANSKLDIDYIRCNEHLFDNARYCLISTELSEDVVAYSINLCHEKNIQVIIKPSSIESLASYLYPKIDYLIPNNQEASRLIRDSKNLEECAQSFLDMGVKNVIITLGSEGCYLRNKRISRYFPAGDFAAVDTTGAADAFISVFAMMLCNSFDIQSSIEIATYAAGVSVTQYGVQGAMIDKSSLTAYIENQINRKA